jgi:integrase
MSVYKRGKNGTYYYDFEFAGQRIKESSKSRSKTIAIEAERKRRRELEEGFNGVGKRVQPKLFKIAAENCLAQKAHTLAPRSLLIERTNLKHILPVLGKLLLTDIGSDSVASYQRQRLKEFASPKTVNLEVGTIRAILRRNKQWANIQQDVRMLLTRDDVGRAISPDEEQRIKVACLKSRSRSLYTIVVLTLNTGLRSSDVRLLTWAQIDLDSNLLTVGKSKTKYSSGRVIALNQEAEAVLRIWAHQFPNREGHHYLFPRERYGASGDAFDACAYHTDPTKPIGSFKKAWQAAKKKASVACRFHDLRHTACTRVLDAGGSFAVLSSIMGWSPATTVRMVKRYGHIGHEAQRQALVAICKPQMQETNMAEKPLTRQGLIQ